MWKVEPPGTGDDTRLFPPFRDEVSHYFLSVNRGKKSIVIDLKTEAGVALAKDLAAKCDILIENYRPGVMDRLGLGYEALSAINPRLIYCAISGFGMTGPLRDRPSFDIVLQAMSGALSVNGEMGGAPMKLGIPLGDLVGGVNGPIGILAALYERSVTGTRPVDRCESARRHVWNARLSRAAGVLHGRTIRSRRARSIPISCPMEHFQRATAPSSSRA